MAMIKGAVGKGRKTSVVINNSSIATFLKTTSQALIAWVMISCYTVNVICKMSIGTHICFYACRFCSKEVSNQNTPSEIVKNLVIDCAESETKALPNILSLRRTCSKCKLSDCQ